MSRVVAFMRRLRAAGVDEQTAMLCAEAFEDEVRVALDELLEGKRAKDRERKRRGNPRNSAESAESAEVAEISRPLPSSPQTPQQPTPTREENTTSREKRGSRLPDDFNPDLAVAEALGLSLAEAAVQADKFLDYWRAVPGAKGRKLDWPATWRNWCRTAADNQARRAPHGPTSHHDAKFDARQANLARHERGADLAARQPRWVP